MAQAPLHTLLHTLSQKSHVFVYVGFLALKIMFSLFMQTQHRNCMCISQHAEIDIRCYSYMLYIDPANHSLNGADGCIHGQLTTLALLTSAFVTCSGSDKRWG